MKLTPGYQLQLALIWNLPTLKNQIWPLRISYFLARILTRLIFCKRCGIEIRFDGNRCINYHTEMPHNIVKCTTKQGYVYCPEHREIFPKSNLCKHYIEYGYKSGESEQHFINLIKEHYEKNSFLNRNKFRKTSHDRMKDKQSCNLCGHVFPSNAKRPDMDLHEEQCKMQTKLV